jgi:SAM-dependent methyltransferase
MGSKATEKYWNDHWQMTQFSIAPEHHPIRKWIESEVTKTNNNSVFEIGHYPGKFLAVFGERGYILNGTDSFIDKDLMMEKWLLSRGYRIGNLYQSDFWSLAISQTFDVVCSFGFIEHFDNWDEAIKRHIQLTNIGGLVMIDVPNLKSPLYYWLYRLFEPEVLKNHILSVMDVSALSEIFIKNNCTIKTADFAGYFYFRFVTRADKLSEYITRIINALRPLFELFPKSIYMRYIVVSAIKKY